MTQSYSEGEHTLSREKRFFQGSRVPRVFCTVEAHIQQRILHRSSQHLEGEPRALLQKEGGQTRKSGEHVGEHDLGEQVTKRCSEGFQKQGAPISGMLLLLKDGLE